MANEITERRGLSVEMTIDAPASAVWKALTDATELTRWFPTGASVTPGAGGKIVYIWNEYDNLEFASNISIWKENEHLRLEDNFGGPTHVVTDYLLESDGNSTKLRLVQSGFTSDESWDEMYDGVRRGWAFELRGLRHYLENHLGKDRTPICLTRPIGDAAPKDVWAKLTNGSAAFLRGYSSDSKEGDAVRIPTPDGETEAHIVLINGSRQVVLCVPSLNDAYLRVTVEPDCASGNGGLAAGIWCSAYSIDAKLADALKAVWGEALPAMQTA